MAQKRLNKSVVVGLTLFGFACMIFASFLMLRNLRQVDPKHFVALAEQYAQKGQYRDAALFYAKAWQVSQDASFLVPHGETLLSAGDVPGALNSWSSALVKRPDLYPAHQRRVTLLAEIARLYGSMEDWRRAQSAAEALASQSGDLSSADRALALHVRGLALTSLGATDRTNMEKGLADLAEAHRLTPDNFDYALELAQRQISAERTGEGEQLLRSLVSRYSTPGGEASRSRVALARYTAQRAEGSGEVEALLQEAAVLAGEDAAAAYDARLAFAAHLAQQWQRQAAAANDPAAAEAQFQQAEQHLRQCLDSDPKRFEGYIQLAALLRTRQRYEDIVALCAQRLTHGFSRKGIQAAREKLFTFQLMILASEACVAQATRGDNPPDATAKEQWLKRAQQFADDAAGEFRAHPRVLSQYGRIKLAQGRDREALEDLRKAEDGYRASSVTDWENKLILARLHVRLQEPGAAKQVLEEVVRRISGPAGIPFWILYAQILVLSNDVGNPQLAAVLAEVQRHDPGNVDARRIRATILERQGKVEQARELIESISDARGLEGMPTLLEAREKFLDGDAEDGISVLLEGLKKTPAQPLLVRAAVAELLTRGRGEEAREVVASALGASPEDRQLQQLSVAVRTDLSREERREAMRKVIESEPDGFQRARELADFWLREGDDAQALAALATAEHLLNARETPRAREATRAEHRELLKAQMLVAARLKDQGVMDRVRQTATDLDIDGAGGKSFLGLYHMLREEFDAAILAWRAVIAEQPTHTRSLASLAQCLHRMGELEEASTWYEKAVEINPSEAVAHRGLAMLARQSGKRNEYLKHLAVCERMIPQDPWVASELLLRQEEADPRAAITRREAELQKKPDDVANLSRLIFLCETVKDVARADGYQEQWLALRPDDREAVVLAGKYYRRTGRPEKALETARRFAETRTTPEARADALILVAAHYLSVGDTEEVEKTLLAAADLANTFEVCHSLGEFYLRKADRPDLALPWYDRAVEWARRDKLSKLPVVLTSRIACALARGVDDLERARAYIEEYRREFPNDPRASLWESDLNVREGRIHDAVAAITRYLGRRSNDAYALYQRARLYAALGRLPAAIEDLESVRRHAPRALGHDPRLLLARLQEQSGRTDLAVRELEALYADAPQSDRVRDALIDAYIRGQRFSEADRVMTAQINRTDVPADPRGYFQRARVSMAMKDAERALADMHRGAEVGGYAPDVLAEVLEAYARLERFADGVAYYQRRASEGNKTPRLLSRYGLLLARSGRSAEAVRAFAEAMERAAREGGDAVRLVTTDLLASFPDPAAAIALFEAQSAAGETGRANDRLLVRLYRAAGRTADATTRLDKLVASAASDGERAELLLERGELRQLTGDYVRARESLEEALKLDPTNWIILNNLAYLLSDQMGEHAAALPHARAAVRSVESADTLDTLGWVYVHLGQYSSAIAELSRAVQYAGASPTIYYHLGEGYRRNRQFKDAVDVLNTGKALAQSVGDSEAQKLIEAALERAAKEDAGTGRT